MAQFFNLGPSQAALQSSMLGEALGSGLGAMLTNYQIGSALDKLTNDPELKNAPLSERWAAAHRAMARFGPRGQQVLQQKLNIESQAEQEKAINRLKNLDLKGMSPQQAIAAFFEATQGHPRAGEMMTASLPYLLGQTASENKASFYGGEGGQQNVEQTAQPSTPQPQMPQAKGIAQPPTGAMPPKEVVQEPVNATPVAKTPMPSGKFDAKKINELSNEYLNELRPDLLQTSAYGNVPTFDFASKSDLRPAEEAQIRQNMNAKKIPFNTQEEILARLREDVRTRYNEAKDRYNLTKDQQQAINDKWARFKADAGSREIPGRLTPFLNQFNIDDNLKKPLLKTQEDLLNRYFQYAASQPTNLTEEDMHARALTLLFKDMDQLNALKEIPSMPPFRGLGDSEKYLRTIADAYKPLIEKGMIESAKEDALYNKDMGLEEFHKAIWGDQTSKDSLDAIDSVKMPVAYVPFLGAENAYNKFTDKVAEKLKNIKPNDDLILLRSALTHKDPVNGVNFFNQALDKAVKNGLKLSAFQETQLQEIKIPREPPLWEYFTLDGPKKLWNIVRGKK